MNINTIAIFGGSFDPIHRAHLAIACEIQEKLHFDRFIFLPCGQPALKTQCYAPAHDRLAMLELALANYPQFEISTHELFQTSPSYTIDSLIYFRQQLGEKVSLSFILGQDAMMQLMQWQHWDRLLDYAHLIYHNRPILAPQFSRDLRHYIQQHQTSNPLVLQSSSHGSIYAIQVQEYALSSTQIRANLHAGHSSSDLDPKVLDYIHQQQLYPNV